MSAKKDRQLAQLRARITLLESTLEARLTQLENTRLQRDEFENRCKLLDRLGRQAATEQSSNREQLTQLRKENRTVRSTIQSFTDSLAEQRTAITNLRFACPCCEDHRVRLCEPCEAREMIE